VTSLVPAERGQKRGMAFLSYMLASMAVRTSEARPKPRSSSQPTSVEASPTVILIGDVPRSSAHKVAR
jgi:hypothetical protein